MTRKGEQRATNQPQQSYIYQTDVVYNVTTV